MYYFIEYMKPILSNLKLNVLKYLRYKKSTKSVWKEKNGNEK